MRPRGRPSGTYGEIAQVLCKHYAAAPGTVRQVAERAQVGYAAAHRTSSRLLQRGDLVVLDDARPMVLGVAGVEPGQRGAASAPGADLDRFFRAAIAAAQADPAPADDEALGSSWGGVIVA